VAHTPVVATKLRTLKLVHPLPLPFANLASRLPALELFQRHLPFEVSIPDEVEVEPPNFLASSLAAPVGTHFADLMQTDILETRLRVTGTIRSDLLSSSPTSMQIDRCEPRKSCAR
jgi:hypothetical protein